MSFKSSVIKNSEITPIDYLLTINELYLLGGILQVPGFLGLEDPFPGFQMDEVKEYMETARQSLTERNYISQVEEGFEIDADLLYCVQTISSSPRIFVATKDEISIFIHASDNLIVKQEILLENRISLSTLDDWDEAKKHLFCFLSIPETSAAPGSGFSINATVIEEAKGMFQDAVPGNAQLSCKRFLVNKGIPSEAAEALSHNLAEKSITGSFVVFDRDKLNLNPIGGIAWLNGSRGTWKVDLPSIKGDDFMKWAPMSSKELINQIEELLSRL